MNTCEHVYKLTGVDPCPLCGKPTHEINWRQVHEQHNQYKIHNWGYPIKQQWEIGLYLLKWYVGIEFFKEDKEQ